MTCISVKWNEVPEVPAEYSARPLNDHKRTCNVCTIEISAQSEHSFTVFFSLFLCYMFVSLRWRERSRPTISVHFNYSMRKALGLAFWPAVARHWQSKHCILDQPRLSTDPGLCLRLVQTQTKSHQ